MSEYRGHFESREAPSGKGFLIHLSCFNEECVDQLKEKLPAGHRRWDPDEEAWWVSEEYIDEAEDIVQEFFDEG